MNQRWKLKFLALILVVIMTLGMLPAAVQAAGGIGTTGIWKWKVLDDGTLAHPSGVTSIGADALNGCNVLSSITVAGTNPAFASEGGVLYNADKTILIPLGGRISI